MICVYDAACTDFSNNGLGPINPSSCQVTETLNGEYELTVIHPIDEIGKWQRLVEGNIVRAPVPAAMTPQINLRITTPTESTLIYRIDTSHGTTPYGNVTSISGRRNCWLRSWNMARSAKRSMTSPSGT